MYIKALKDLYEKLEPEIRAHAWRTPFVTSVEAKDNKSVTIIEDYANAATELFQKRLQELGSGVSKFELSNKVFTYFIELLAPLKEIDNIATNIFAAIEWPAGCVLQTPELANSIKGNSLQFLPWDQKGPQKGWTSWSLPVPNKKESLPVDQKVLEIRARDLFYKHLKQLDAEKMGYVQAFQATKIAAELQALRDEYSDNPLAQKLLGDCFFKECVQRTPQMAESHGSGYSVKHYKHDSLTLYLGVIIGTFRIGLL